MKEQFIDDRNREIYIEQIATELHGLTQEQKRVLGMCKQFVLEVSLDTNTSSDIMDGAQHLLKELKIY